jgi:hypothetical protein
MVDFNARIPNYHGRYRYNYEFRYLHSEEKFHENRRNNISWKHTVTAENLHIHCTFEYYELYEQGIIKAHSSRYNRYY